VVVVEDEPDIAGLLCELLILHGFEPVAATGFEQLGDLLTRVQPDMFLIDVMLRGKSGIEVARDLQQTSYATTPMVAMSASRTMARFAGDSGLFREVLEKPFDIDGLAEMINRCIPAPA
jgi:two-component system phosphate regulon response regulator PhoB